MNRDPYEEMMEFAVGVGILAIVGVGYFLAVQLSGCTVTHEVPVAEQAVAVVDKFAQKVQEPPRCPTLKLDQVPATLTLELRNGRFTEATDAGGKQVLQGYLQCRQLSQGVQHVAPPGM